MSHGILNRIHTAAARIAQLAYMSVNHSPRLACPDPNYDPRCRSLASYSSRRLISVALPTSVFLLALLNRLAFLETTSQPLLDIKNDSMVYSHIARLLIETGEYFKGSASRPPGYPVLLALIYALRGYDPEAVKLVQAVMDSCTAVVVYALAIALVRCRWVALLAGWWYALFYSFVHFSSRIMTETPFILLLYSAVYLIVMAQVRKSWVLGLLSGSLLGLAALTRPTIQYFPLLLVVALAVIDWRLFRRLWPILLALLLGFLLTLSPWTIRNMVVLKSFVPVSTNSGVNLLIGNNPDATGGYINPPQRYREVADSLTEAEQSNYYKSEAIKWIRENPKSFLQLCGARFAIAIWLSGTRDFEYEIREVYRVGEFRGVRVLPFVRFEYVYPLAVVGLIGAAFGWWRRRLTGLQRSRASFLIAVLATLLVYCTFLQSVVINNYRMSLPMMPVWILGAAVGVRFLSLAALKALRRPKARIAAAVCAFVFGAALITHELCLSMTSWDLQRERAAEMLREVHDRLAHPREGLLLVSKRSRLPYRDTYVMQVRHADEDMRSALAVDTPYSFFATIEPSSANMSDFRMVEELATLPPRAAWVEVSPSTHSLLRDSLQSVIPSARHFRVGLSLGTALTLEDFVLSGGPHRPGDRVAFSTRWRRSDPWRADPSARLQVLLRSSVGGSTHRVGVVELRDRRGRPPEAWPDGARVIVRGEMALPTDLAPGKYELLLFPVSTGAVAQDWEALRVWRYQRRWLATTPLDFDYATEGLKQEAPEIGYWIPRRQYSRGDDLVGYVVRRQHVDAIPDWRLVLAPSAGTPAAEERLAFAEATDTRLWQFARFSIPVSRDGPLGPHELWLTFEGNRLLLTELEVSIPPRIFLDEVAQKLNGRDGLHEWYGRTISLPVHAYNSFPPGGYSRLTRNPEMDWTYNRMVFTAGTANHVLFLNTPLGEWPYEFGDVLDVAAKVRGMNHARVILDVETVGLQRKAGQ